MWGGSGGEWGWEWGWGDVNNLKSDKIVILYQPFY